MVAQLQAHKQIGTSDFIMQASSCILANKRSIIITESRLAKQHLNSTSADEFLPPYERRCEKGPVTSEGEE
eukprot:1186347-Prorocentrum_minimum.AAC.4